MADDKLSRDDLYLLMDSYKNTIELNTTLSHQQNAIIEQQHLILEQDKKTGEKMDLLIQKLGDHTTALTNIQTEMTVTNSARRLECNKEHSSMTIKVYGVIASLIIIIIALIALIKPAHNYNEIKTVVDEIAVQVGVTK